MRDSTIDCEAPEAQDPFRTRDGMLKRYSTGVMISITDPVFLNALGLKVGMRYWLLPAADNRSFTVHLDPPVSNGGGQ